MVDCHEMRLGQVYVCRDCGLRLQVIAECRECESDECRCEEPCRFECCGEPLALQEESKA
jgi:hypothetical protein